MFADLHGVNTSTMADFKLPLWTWEETNSGTSLYSIFIVGIIDVINLKGIDNSKI